MDAYGIVSITGVAAIALISAGTLADSLHRVHAQAVKAVPSAVPSRRRRRRRRRPQV
jgi:hypothetical protein